MSTEGFSDDDIMRRNAEKYGFGDDVDAYVRAAERGELLGRSEKLGGDAAPAITESDLAHYMVSPTIRNGVVGNSPERALKLSEEEYRKRVDILKQQQLRAKGSFEAGQEFTNTLRELEAIAEGGGDEEVRKFYPGWRNEDFARLVEELSANE